MAETDEAEVKDIERVEIEPAGGDNIDEEKETPPESSQEETADKDDGDKIKAKPEIESETKEKEIEKDKTPIPETDSDIDDGKIKRLPNETNREYALRLEVTNLKEQMRQTRTGEIFIPPAPTVKKELSPERKKILEKYKPEDIQTLKDVFDVMAEDMGFVRSDKLEASTFQQKSTEILDDFLEKHPEYQPENDHGNVLWNRFKDEFAQYRPAKSPKELLQFLNKTHREVFGIKSATSLNKENATKEKAKVASHSGASKPIREGIQQRQVIQGLRTDMLKGFSDEEIAELTGE